MARAQLINPTALAESSIDGGSGSSSGGGSSLPSSIPAAIITQDSTHRFVTDSEKSGWDGKLDAVTMMESGVTKGNVTTIDVVGADVSVAGDTATVTITGGGSGVTISGNSYFPAGWL